MCFPPKSVCFIHFQKPFKFLDTSKRYLGAKKWKDHGACRRYTEPMSQIRIAMFEHSSQIIKNFKKMSIDCTSVHLSCIYITITDQCFMAATVSPQCIEHTLSRIFVTLHPTFEAVRFANATCDSLVRESTENALQKGHMWQISSVNYIQVQFL